MTISNEDTMKPNPHFAKQTITWLGGEHDFCLTWAHALMLESSTDLGIMTLYNKLNSDGWRAPDVRETIRIGLIGGGASPEDAAKLVKNFVENNPAGIAPSVILALTIVGAFIFGVANPEAAPLASEGVNEPVTA